MEQESGASANAETGSREPDPQAVPALSGFDPARGAIALIKKIGIYGLGGNDGCPCTNFEVQNVHVDVSCHKSQRTVRVYSHHADFCDENYRRDQRFLRPIADEVLRQVDGYYDAGGEYAADFLVKFCSWDEERASDSGSRAER